MGLASPSHALIDDHSFAVIRKRTRTEKFLVHGYLRLRRHARPGHRGFAALVGESTKKASPTVSRPPSPGSGFGIISSGSTR